MSSTLGLLIKTLRHPITPVGHALCQARLSTSLRRCNDTWLLEVCCAPMCYGALTWDHSVLQFKSEDSCWGSEGGGGGMDGGKCSLGCDRYVSSINVNEGKWETTATGGWRCKLQETSSYRCVFGIAVSNPAPHRPEELYSETPLSTKQ